MKTKLSPFVVCVCVAGCAASGPEGVTSVSGSDGSTTSAASSGSSEGQGGTESDSGLASGGTSVGSTQGETSTSDSTTEGETSTSSDTTTEGEISTSSDSTTEGEISTSSDSTTDETSTSGETSSGGDTQGDAVCGDGVVEPDEQCDLGDLNVEVPGYEECSQACVWGPRCGDGIAVKDFDEECDNESAACVKCQGVCGGGNIEKCGEHKWSESFTGGGFGGIVDVAVDTKGNIFALGWFDADVNLGDDPNDQLVNAGDTDVFVAKFSAQGKHLWSKGYGDGARQRPNKIRVDAEGSVIVLGSFDGEINFSDNVNDKLIADMNPNADGLAGVFVAKLTTDGAHVWSKAPGGKGGLFMGLAILGTDAVVSSAFTGKVNFGKNQATELVSSGTDMFVARLDGSGEHVWSKRADGAGKGVWDVGVLGIAVDSAENIVIAGDFWSKVNFGPDASTELVASGVPDAFVVRLNGAGEYGASWSIAGENQQTILDVEIGTGGDVFLGGWYNGVTNFSGKPGDEKDPDGFDGFVARYQADGTYVWSRSLGGDLSQAVYELELDASGHMFISGTSHGVMALDTAPATPVFTDGADGIFVIRLDEQADLVWGKRYADSVAAFPGALEIAQNDLILGGYFQSEIDFGGELLKAAQGSIFLARIAQ